MYSIHVGDKIFYKGISTNVKEIRMIDFNVHYVLATRAGNTYVVHRDAIILDGNQYIANNGPEYRKL
ncbi:hypothetical protein [Thalassobacillus devorans]|uniref:hypothetical protein n=1 Tax=Thalassobacillus devorans TaxID=279813 RepID=UPI000A1CC9B8|nr:hypothetical protein [Thalassobacillus devorans]